MIVSLYVVFTIANLHVLSTFKWTKTKRKQHWHRCVPCIMQQIDPNINHTDNKNKHVFLWYGKQKYHWFLCRKFMGHFCSWRRLLLFLPLPQYTYKTLNHIIITCKTPLWQQKYRIKVYKFCKCPNLPMSHVLARLMHCTSCPCHLFHTKRSNTQTHH
jgi:hypothetical protein